MVKQLYAVNREAYTTVHTYNVELIDVGNVLYPFIKADLTHLDHLAYNCILQRAVISLAVEYYSSHF